MLDVVEGQCAAGLPFDQGLSRSKVDLDGPEEELDELIALRSRDDLVGPTAVDREVVRSTAALELVVPRSRPEAVASAAAGGDVVTVVEIVGVRVIGPVDVQAVVAAPPAQDVVASPADEDLVSRRPEHDVVVARAVHPLDAREAIGSLACGDSATHEHAQPVPRGAEVEVVEAFVADRAIGSRARIQMLLGRAPAQDVVTGASIEGVASRPPECAARDQFVIAAPSRLVVVALVPVYPVVAAAPVEPVVAVEIVGADVVAEAADEIVAAARMDLVAAAPPDDYVRAGRPRQLVFAFGPDDRRFGSEARRRSYCG